MLTRDEAIINAWELSRDVLNVFGADDVAIGIECRPHRGASKRILRIIRAVYWPEAMLDMRETHTREEPNDAAVRMKSK